VCFNAAASFGSAVVIGGIGGATLPLVHDRRQIPFASLPLIFCVHQLLEGVVWMQIHAAGGTTVRTPAVEVWLLIAWVLLPVLIPLSVRWFEPDPRRRNLMLGLAGLGVLVGAYLGIGSMVWSTVAEANRHHLEYRIPAHGWLMAIPYVAATIGPMLASSARFVVRFGLAMLGAMALTVVVDAKAFSSMWCFFAALLSVGLYLHYARSPSAKLRQPDLAA